MKEKILPCGCHKVTSDGEVFTCIEQYAEKGKCGVQYRAGEWRKLRCVMTKSGYLQTSLHGRIVRVNRLIAINFIPNPMSLPESQHKNGVRMDNRVANLKWGNQQANAEDRETHGNSIHGEKSRTAKLTDVGVRNIRLRIKKGQTLQRIADTFGVSKKLILLVKQQKIWRHVK